MFSYVGLDMMLLSSKKTGSTGRMIIYRVYEGLRALSKGVFYFYLFIIIIITIIFFERKKERKKNYISQFLNMVYMRKSEFSAMELLNGVCL